MNSQKQDRVNRYLDGVNNSFDTIRSILSEICGIAPDLGCEIDEALEALELATTRVAYAHAFRGSPSACRAWVRKAIEALDALPDRETVEHEALKREAVSVTVLA